MLRRYARRVELLYRLQAACAGLGGDYSGARLGLLLLALRYLGARRLEHLQYLVGDPLVRRLARLARVPTARTVSNWLRRFTQDTLRPVVQLNRDPVLDSLARLAVPRLTVDVVRSMRTLRFVLITRDHTRGPRDAHRGPQRASACSLPGDPGPLRAARTWPRVLSTPFHKYGDVF